MIDNSVQVAGPFMYIAHWFQAAGSFKSQANASKKAMLDGLGAEGEVSKRTQAHISCRTYLFTTIQPPGLPVAPTQIKSGTKDIGQVTRRAVESITSVYFNGFDRTMTPRTSIIDVLLNGARMSAQGSDATSRLDAR